MPDVTPRFKVERIRSKAHLARIRTLPCCIPGCHGQPVDAHHLTHAEPKARGLKSGDNWTVPLCHTIHHTAQTGDGVHARGNERGWWASWGIDPIALAARLWAETQSGKEMP